MGVITLDDENDRLIYDEIDKKLPDDGEWHTIKLNCIYQKRLSVDGEVKFILVQVGERIPHAGDSNGNE